MELTRKNIEGYIERFMEGETTNAEEQAIYRFFRNADVPEHLKSYAPMFAWYEEGMRDEHLPMRKEPEMPVRLKKPIYQRIPAEVCSIGIAAMLVIGIGLGMILSYDGGQCKEWSCYEGSYVEVNGKRITDLEQIMPVILEVISETEQMEKDVEERLAEILRIEEYVSEKEAMFINY